MTINSRSLTTETLLNGEEKLLWVDYELEPYASPRFSITGIWFILPISHTSYQSTPIEGPLFTYLARQLDSEVEREVNIELGE